MDSVASRLKKAMELRGITQSELVKKTGIGKSSVSTYLSGEYIPKQKNTYKLAKALNVNEAWLLGQDVEIERKDNVKALTDKEFKLLNTFNCLNDTGKAEAQKRIEELTFIDKYKNEMLSAAARGGNLNDLPNSEAIDEDINYTKDPYFL